MVIITAKVRLQPGTSERFLEAVRLMQPQVMKDPGAIQYSLHRSADDPDAFVFYERYDSEEAFAYHLSTGHFRALTETIDPLMAAPPEIDTWVETL
jgi:quinol monooxygenase YgiN